MSNKADLSPDIAVLFGQRFHLEARAEGCARAAPGAQRSGQGPDRPHTVDGDILGGFDIALQKLRDGYGVRRRGWNGAGLTVRMQVPDAHSKMTLPYLYIEYPATHPVTPGARCPWLASQTDLCATDWELVVP